MATRLTRSQVETLIKTRAHLSDQQLYEMMKSRHVFQVQTELSRDLEHMKKSIQHDQKVMMAKLQCQKAMFLKKVNAKKKGMRYLVSVKIHFGGEVSGEINNKKKSDEDVRDKAEVDERLLPKESEMKTTRMKPSKDHRVCSRIVENPGTISTPNEIWMRRISERSSKTTSALNNIKEIEGALKRAESFIKFDSLAGNLSQRVERSGTFNSDNEKLLPSIPDAVAASRKRQKLAAYRSLSSDSFRFRSSSVNKTTDNYSNRATRPRQKPASAISKIKSTRDMMPLKTKNNIKPTEPEKPNREKTVTMLFVDREEDRTWPTVSPFNVEAWLEQNRQKRGHTVVVSTTYLDTAANSVTGSNEVRGEGAALHKSRRLLRGSIQQRPLRFALSHDRPINIRKRGNDWFTNFSAEKSKVPHPPPLPSPAPPTQRQRKPLELGSDVQKHHTHVRGRKMVLPPIGSKYDPVTYETIST